MQSYFWSRHNFNMILSPLTPNLFQIRTGEGDPTLEERLEMLVFQIFGTGVWKLGRCIPSECTGEDAAKVKSHNQSPTISLYRVCRIFWSG